MTPTEKMPHFRELDGVRGLAALWIFFHHFFMGLPPATTHLPLWERFLRSVAEYGFLAVDVFFVLSGFLITSLLLQDRRNPHYFHNFYWKRVLRIQPAFWVFVVAYALCVHGPGIGKYLILCVLFIANFAPALHVFVGSVAWSLCIEEQFYLIWPQFIRRLDLKWVGRFAVLLIVASIGLRVNGLLVLGHANLAFTPYRLDGLGLGALAACMRFDRQGLGSGVQRFATALRSRLALLLMLIGAVLTVAYGRAWTEPLCITLTGLLSFQVISSIGAGRSIAWLRSRPLVFMGGISYSFYLYHGFLQVALLSRFPSAALGRPAGMALYFLAAFAATLVASYLSLIVIERPAQTLRRFVLKRPVQPEIEPPPLYVGPTA